MVDGWLITRCRSVTARRHHAASLRAVKPSRGASRAPFGPLAAALALLLLYLLLRTLDVDAVLALAWTAAAVLLALISPAGGLLVLGVLAPFTEAQTSSGMITPVPFLIVALAVSVAGRLVRTRPLPRPSLPLGLALALLAGTLLGVLHTLLNLDGQHGVAAFEGWLVGIGGATLVLLSAAYVAWSGELRPAIVAGATIAAAAGISLLDFATSGGVVQSALGWLLRQYNADRLTEIIPAPDASAAVFVAGAAVGLAAAAFASRRTTRVAGVVAAATTVAALAFTYSRSAWLALAMALALLAWRWRRWAGLIAVAAVGLAAAVAIVAGLVREVPAAADQARLDAWIASVRMWLADPLLGQGFRTFEWLHTAYGSPLLDAPHNEWLRFFAEEGVLVGVAGLAFAVLTPLVILRGHGWLQAGAAAAAAAVFVMAVFNNPFLYEQVTVPVFLLIGTGLGLAQRHRATQGSSRRNSAQPAAAQAPI